MIERFSFSDCRIRWKRGIRMLMRNKLAVQEELDKLSDLIWQAMNFTKTWNERENHDVQVKIYLNTDDCDARMWYESSAKCWCMDIYANEDLIGEVESEKWRIMRLKIEGMET